MNELGTFDIDPRVVTGWNEKSLLREADLSKFVPLGKLFAVLKKNDIKKGENRGFEIQLKNRLGNDDTKIRIEEVGQIISQTQDQHNFRGGIGITEISNKYVSIEAGAMEVRVGVIISNFEQLSYDINKSAIHMFYPGKEFLLVYGWQSDNNTASIFEGNANNISIVDLENFDKGYRRYLYCTLHHFEWNFGDQGRIYGVLTFWAPDTVRLSLKRLDMHTDDIVSLMQSPDIAPLYENFKKDVNKYEKDNENSSNKKLLKHIEFRMKNEFNKKEKVDSQELQIFATAKSVGIGSRVLPTNPGLSKDDQFKYTNPFSTKTEKIYLGWIIESVRLTNNTESAINKKDIYVRYKDFLKSKPAEVNLTYYTNNVAKQLKERFEFSNPFFVPVSLVTMTQYIRDFRGSFKFFLDSLLQRVNEEYSGVLSLVLKINNNGVYEIDDIREKSISKNDELKTTDGKHFKHGNEVTPVLTYGFSNSLVYNIKISSTILPDIIWAQSITLDMSEEDAAEFLQKVINDEKNSNPQFHTIYLEYIAINEEMHNEERLPGDEASAKPSKSDSAATLFIPAENKIRSKQVITNVIQKDTTIAPLILGDRIDSGKIELGTIMRNYFNGMTITIHGTVGFQAFKSFLFKGFELLTSRQGIDGLYSIIMVNDIVTPKGFQTILEARRINSLPIL